MNYVFFIGGSGARVYTAFLHACAAGVIQADDVTRSCWTRMRTTPPVRKAASCFTYTRTIVI